MKALVKGLICSVIIRAIQRNFIERRAEIGSVVPGCVKLVDILEILLGIRDLVQDVERGATPRPQRLCKVLANFLLKLFTLIWGQVLHIKVFECRKVLHIFLRYFLTKELEHLGGDSKAIPLDGLSHIEGAVDGLKGVVLLDARVDYVKQCSLVVCLFA